MTSDPDINKNDKEIKREPSKPVSDDAGSLDCASDKSEKTEVKNANAAGLGSIGRNDESLPGSEPEQASDKSGVGKY